MLPKGNRHLQRKGKQVTAEEKSKVYNFLKTASSWSYGYPSPTFKEEPAFEDDIEIPEEHDDVPVDFTADKEAFLKACENMFDALVAKFNK